MKNSEYTEKGYKLMNQREFRRFLSEKLKDLPFDSLFKIIQDLSGPVSGFELNYISFLEMKQYIETDPIRFYAIIAFEITRYNTEILDSTKFKKMTKIYASEFTDKQDNWLFAVHPINFL